MEVYILDDLFRRVEVVDRFESLIWTERYSAMGEFQLVMHSTLASRGILTEGTKLALNQSNRVMVIETVEKKDDSEGRSMVTASGRSFESILEARAARQGWGGLDTLPQWTLGPGKPADLIRQVFKTICVDGALNKADIIVPYTAGSLYPANTIAEPEAQVSMTVKLADLYTVIKEACDVFGLGFRLYRGPDNHTIYFNVYSGDDRTSSQSTLPAVIFSPDLENITNVSDFRSIEKFKNIALVVAKNRSIYVGNGQEVMTGYLEYLYRRVLLVDATDLDNPTHEQLQERGREALVEHKPIRAMDGELQGNTKYRYGQDYNVGDLVEIRSEDGLTNRMRVTEQIFVDDSQGERSYPTLVLDEFITPGTWYAWDGNAVWDEAQGVWDFIDGSTSSPSNLLPNGRFETGTTAGWVLIGNGSINSTSVAADVSEGKYALRVVTTAANAGASSIISGLAESPVGSHAVNFAVKTTASQKLKLKFQECNSDGTIRVESSPVTITGTGAYQNLAYTYTKVYAATFLRVVVLKDTAGTFFLDNVVLRKV